MKHPPVVFLERLNLHRCGVGQLIAQLPDNLFPNQLCSQKSLTPICYLIFGKQMRPNRGEMHEMFSELIQPLRSQSRNREYTLKCTLLRQLLNKGQQGVLHVHQIYFVDY